MFYIMLILMFGLLLGLMAVASNPSPYYAALGLVLVAGVSCGILVSHGGSFLSLILFLIYLGGMLVVFAYSAALASEPYPEGWGSYPVLTLGTICLLGVGGGGVYLMDGWHGDSWISAEECGELGLMRGDVLGVAALYGGGAGVLVVAGGVLLITLFVVLELTRGLSRGSLRAV